VISAANGIDGLKRLLTAPPRPARQACELCHLMVEEAHSHLVDLTARSLLCVCRPCGLLFATGGAAQGRYRLVPDRWVVLGDAAGPAWDLLDIPVGVAFFFFNSTLGRVAAMYPSPAGATESTLPLEAWEDMVSANPVLATLEPDVEALLVRRSRGDSDAFVVPIDACYELAGLVRTHWKGFDGGEDAGRAIGAFFDRVRSKSRATSVEMP
jgi:hypothetical protein